MNTLPRFAALLLLAVVPAVLFAQDQPKENLSAKGTLRGVFAGGIQLATDDNEAWKVKLPDKPSEISYSANAEQSFLRPGMKVKFSAVMNRKGIVQEPITSLTVFTPLKPADLGVWPETEGEGAYNPLAGLFNTEEPKEQPKVKGKKPVVEDVACRVGGTLKSLKSGRMVVVAGRMQIKCELAENAKIRVSTSDLSLAQLGDKVEVEGWYYANAKQAGLWANQLSITAAEPLTGEKKKSGKESEEKEEVKEEKTEEGKEKDK